ncbi:MAG: tripartite tricarboxylate transporter substrate binding protein [Betaproteobacteria bacterium]|nr:tripartite tricarboxylate transporter substrate binding protein [Betaproteobacteria bacterium]
MTLAAAALAQQGYPNRTIKIVSPYASGGSSSALARLLAERMSQNWGQPVIVDDRPGGNTIIGSEAVARSAPDGYTILWQASAHVINPLLFKTPYDAIKDFIPVGTVGSTELMLVVNPAVPLNSVQDVIAAAKAKPDSLNYASTGVGGPPHIAAELFKSMTGTRIQHIPYKGVGPAMTDLVGGQVQIAFQTPAAALQFVKTGKLRALAISGDKRLPALPDVPTFAEAGLSNFDVKFWFGVFVPAGTPKDIVDKLSAEVARIITVPEVVTKLDGAGLLPFTSTPVEFAKLVQTDSIRYERLIKEAKITAE